MTKYEKAAQRAVANMLAGISKPVTLWSVSCNADEAARRAGKVRDLYESLYDYEWLVPAGFTMRWLTARPPMGDSLYMVCPPGWEPGSTSSQSLLLGNGPLVETRAGA